MDDQMTLLLAQARVKGAEAKALLDKGQGMTQEDAENLKRLNGELTGLKGQIEAARATGQAADEVKATLDWLGKPTQVLGFSSAGDTEVKTDTGEVISTGAGLLSEAQAKAIRSPEYKSAYNTYLRKGLGGLSSVEVKVVNEGVDDQGGFIAPEDIQQRVIQKKPTPTRLAPMTTEITTGRDSVVFPRVVWTTDDLYTTGMRVTWTGEIPASATTHRATEPVWGQFRVPVYTAMISVPLTNNMVEDASFDVTAWITEKFSETIDLLKDNMILSGTGVNQPSGILENPDGANEPAEVHSGHATLLTGDGLVNLAGAVPEQYDENCRFIFNKTNTHLAIRKLKDGDGLYLFGTNRNEGLTATMRPTDLLGYPYAWSGFMPDVGANTHPVIFGDLQGYMLVQRVGFSIQILRELYAETNQIVALGRLRIGGDVAEPWRLKVQSVEA